jgi:hypothetical protein
MNKLAKKSTLKLADMQGKLYNFIVSSPRLSASSIAIFALIVSSSSVKAQPICQPPNSGEYLLLIVTKTPEQQEIVKRSFPGDTNNTVCRYIDDTVTRVAGFRSSQIAGDWVKYIQDVVGLPAYVVRSPTASITQNLPVYNPQPATNSDNASVGFNPQSLGPGYAVLVDYFNQPELAAKVREALGVQVGLASYGQRPFLFIAYTTDQNAATAAVKTLSDRGFWPMLVDSRRVTLISPAVR